MTKSSMAIGLLCVLLAAPIGATVIVPATLAELSQEARVKLLDTVNFYGLSTQLDPQGRVQIPTELRETAALTADAEVYVMGQLECLAVWNQARYREYRAGRRTTPEDRKEREKFGL